MPKKNQNFVVGLVPNSSQTIWIHYSALQNVSFLCQRLRSSDWEKKKRKQHMHTPGNTGDTVGHVKEEASVNVSGGSCPICSIMLVIWTKLCWKFFSMWPAVFFFSFSCDHDLAFYILLRFATIRPDRLDCGKHPVWFWFIYKGNSKLIVNAWVIFSARVYIIVHTPHSSSLENLLNIFSHMNV